MVVREFTAVGQDSDALTVAGAPAAAAGSSLAAAADGNVDSAYTAGGSPQAGDAVVVTLPKARPLDRVVVAGRGSGQVQVGDGTSWQTVGSLSSGYTELLAGGAVASQIRLVWTAGSPAPEIAEVVPWYADAPAAALFLTPASLDVEVGATAATTVGVTATRAEDVQGALTVDAPSGVTAAPASTPLTLRRGAQPSVEESFSASAPGNYQVPVSFAGVSQTLILHVHPHVSATNVALASQGAVASASTVEQNLPQFTADHANDGDPATRWSSEHTDDQWLQVKFASPQHLGKVTLRWETAHAAAYRIETSADGTTWTEAADVTGSQGGTETVWIDESGVNYLRMQGVSRATQFGYSIYELAAYPVA